MHELVKYDVLSQPPSLMSEANLHIIQFLL